MRGSAAAVLTFFCVLVLGSWSCSAAAHRAAVAPLLLLLGQGLAG